MRAGQAEKQSVGAELYERKAPWEPYTLAFSKNITKHTGREKREFEENRTQAWQRGRSDQTGVLRQLDEEVKGPNAQGAGTVLQRTGWTQRNRHAGVGTRLWGGSCCS